LNFFKKAKPTTPPVVILENNCNMAKTAHGGFTPPKGNPSGNGRDQQGEKDLGGRDLENEEEIAARYTDENEEPAANVPERHPNRNVNKGENTNKPNQSLDL
jgi:hypothetical protein